MSTEIINHKALLKSVFISAIFSTVIMSIVSGYGKTITPEGIVNHYYNFSSVVLWGPILFMVMAPVIALVAYVLGMLLIKSRLSLLSVVIVVGAAGGGLFIYAFSDNLIIFSMVGAYYIFMGAVSAITSFYLYTKFNTA